MHGVCLDKPELGQSRKISTKKKTQNTMLRLPFSNGKLYNYTNILVNGKKVSMSPQNAINKQHLRTFRLMKSLCNYYIRDVKPISFNWEYYTYSQDWLTLLNMFVIFICEKLIRKYNQGTHYRFFVVLARWILKFAHKHINQFQVDEQGC